MKVTIDPQSEVAKIFNLTFYFAPELTNTTTTKNYSNYHHFSSQQVIQPLLQLSPLHLKKITLAHLSENRTENILPLATVYKFLHRALFLGKMQTVSTPGAGL